MKESGRPSRVGAWRARQVVVVACGVFVLQFWLLHLASSPPAPRPPAYDLTDRILLVTDSNQADRIRAAAWLPDSGEFATVLRHGFTSQVWTNLTQPRPHFATPLPDPLFLAHTDYAEPGVFLSSLAANPAPTVEFHEAHFEVPHVPTLAPLRSRLHVEGELVGRRIVSAPALPVWPFNDELTNTTVQIVVDQDGTVLSAVPLDNCGYAPADNRALTLARQVLFAPLPHPTPATRLAWGRLVFAWATVPPPSASHPPAHR